MNGNAIGGNKMLVPIKWLKEYIDLDVDIKTFCEKMIMSGSNIETTETLMKGIEGVYVGKIINIENHPDADKLKICKVDIAKENPITIVTGATNVFEGAKVAVVIDGGKIPGPLHGKPKDPNGVKISKGKLRGVESEGMLCSLTELGFEDKVIPLSQKEGIWILPNSMIVGNDIASATDLEDEVVEFEITPNRADCLSMIGMAREAVATFGGELKYPALDITSEEGDAAKYIQVQIDDNVLCSRYMAKIVTDVKIEESPWWLQKRLMSAGMRPINNIVDITNFVMLEFGQPIHAFDISNVEENKIIVSRAEDGSEFTTLDDKTRELDASMLMIKDGRKDIAIAGIMGGLNSEIKNDTSTILVEIANFNADNIRATSKKLSLRTEASSRYEKGIDPNICALAGERVCQLIEKIGVGTVVNGTVDNYPNKYYNTEISIRVSRINEILGTSLTIDEIIIILEKLEIKCKKNKDSISVTPPTSRLDLLKEIDYVEEVARIFGYDNLPLTLPAGKSISYKEPKREFIDRAKEIMCSLGANEIQTYSFVSPRDIDKIQLESDVWERNFVELINPLGEEQSVMRTILAPSMLEVMGRNYSRNIDKLRAFEINTTFSKCISDEKNLPEEETGMVIGFYGNDENFYSIKGACEELLDNLGIEGYTFVAESNYALFHPGRCARIIIEEQELGIIGEIHPKVSKNYGIDTRGYLCEFFLDNVFEHADKTIYYKQLPKYPSIIRDIALIVDEEIQVADIMNVIKEKNKIILEKVELFDVYRGKQIQEGKKSVAFTMTYRDKNRTLTDEDVSNVYNDTLEALEKKFKVLLREV